MDNSKLNSRVLWKTLKSIFPTKAKQMSRINSLTKDGTSYSTPEVRSNVFNEHFISIADNIIDNIINTEPDLTSLVDFVNRKKAGNSADFSIPLISEREVLENIKPLHSVATGLDGISSPLLKLIAPAVAPSLAKVINCSIINSICPAQLKLALVTPIRFTNRGVKSIVTITDLYQSSLSFRRFSRNMSANTLLLFSLITIYCTNATRVLELTTPAKPSL